MDSAYYTPIVAVVVFVASVLVIMSRSKRKLTAMDPEKWQSFPVVEIEKVSHDVKRIRFGLPSKEHVVGLPVGQHIALKFETSEGKEIQRSYTPVTSDDDKGFVDFVIKVYHPNVHPKFPAGGVMSMHLDGLKLGDSMMMRGPKGHLTYHSRGHFDIVHRGNKTSYSKKRLGMVAGGTGITPILQVVRAILKDPSDRTEVWILFANQTEEDILLRGELEALPKDRFHVWYTLDRPPTDWSFSSGFVNTEMCRGHLPAPSPDTMLFLCGPRPMIQFACEPAFKEIGFVEGDWYAF